MAVTKFLTRKTRLNTIIKYIMNGEKTEKMMYVSGVNCRPDTAIYEMQDTKKRFDKEDGIISYHLIQSFDGKEISPKKCHELGLQYAKELFDKNIIDEYDVTKILLFTHFSNSLFILGTIGIFLNQKLAFLILISHYLGNFIIGIIFRNYHPSYSDSNIKIQSNISNNFIETLTSSLFKTIDTLLLLLGIISTFLIITCMISDILSINQNLQYFINGIIEMTQGIKYICSSNIDINLKAIVSTFFISFGGICIHAQVKSVLKGVNMKYKIYLLARILHAFISSTILFLLINI